MNLPLILNRLDWILTHKSLDFIKSAVSRVSAICSVNWASINTTHCTYALASDTYFDTPLMFTHNSWLCWLQEASSNFCIIVINTRVISVSAFTTASIAMLGQHLWAVQWWEPTLRMDSYTGLLFSWLQSIREGTNKCKIQKY